MNIGVERKGIHPVFFIWHSCVSARQLWWGVILPRLLILLMVGMFLTATSAWSSGQDFLTAEKLYPGLKDYAQAEQYYSKIDSQ